MSKNNTRCLICLDGPKRNNPLRLLDCGCSTPWLHTSCEKEFVSFYLHCNSFICTVCKRHFKYNIVYSFNPSHGKNQQDLFFTFILFCFEVIYSTYYNNILLPLISIFLCSIPFFINPCDTIFYFFYQLKIKYLINLSVFLYNLLFIDGILIFDPFHNKDLINSFFLFGILHLTFVLIVSVYFPGRETDPFSPFILMKNLSYKQIMDY